MSSPDSRQPLLRVTDLRTTFVRNGVRTEAVRGVSFALHAGRTLMLLGESGSGKSATARSILRLYGASAQLSGSVRLADQELIGLDDRAMRSIRGKRMALIPQDPTGALDPLCTVGEQISEVLRVHGEEPTRGAAARRAEELLDLVGIAEPHRTARSYPHQLSGGMRQRAVIAIAISCSPEVLIADEPTTALDVTTQAQILELIKELRRIVGTAVLMVTHDVGVAADHGDDVAVMFAGQIVESGAARSVLRNPGHPYTAALLAAQPRPGIPRGMLPTLTESMRGSFDQQSGEIPQ